VAPNPKPPIGGLARSPGLWLTLVAAAAYCFLAVPHWKPTWDSAIYLSLARAIAHGEGYTYMGYVHAHYPPGLPLLLSPIVLLAGDSFLVMRLAMAACAAGSVGMTYRLVRRFADPGASLAVSLMTGASWVLFSEATYILSDIPYLLLSLVALDRIECYVRERSRRNFLLMAASVAAATGMRTVGVALAAAGAGAIVFGRNAASARARLRPAGILLGIALLVALGGTARNALSGSRMPAEMRESASYLKEVVSSDPDNPRAAPVDARVLLERARLNAGVYGAAAADILAHHRKTDGAWRLVLGGLCLAGWLAGCARGPLLLGLYAASYAGICLFWNALPAPTHEAVRYLVPLLPFFFYYLLQPVAWLGAGLAMLFPRRAPDARAVIALACAGIIVARNIPEDISRVRAEHRVPYLTAEVADFLRAVRWISERTPKDSVVIADRAPYVWCWAQRRAFSGPWLSDPREVFDSWTRNGVSHVITGDGDHSRRFINPSVEAFPEHFRLVCRFGENALYEKLP